MLTYFKNLTQIVNLSDYNVYIKSLHPFEGNKWGIKSDEMKKMKTYIHQKLEEYQNKHCAYCGLEYMATTYTNIEHIAPKKKYPQFMFKPENLVASCGRCNGFEKKGNRDTITNLVEEYNQCEFLIVHPYFDNPQDHFDFANQIQGLVITGKTAKGKTSIDFFLLNDTYMVEQRSKQYFIDHTTPEQRQKQIEAIMIAKE
jgi:uncharacterized protein (TIGR02646 family)